MCIGAARARPHAARLVLLARRRTFTYEMGSTSATGAIFQDGVQVASGPLSTMQDALVRPLLPARQSVRVCMMTTALFCRAP